MHPRPKATRVALALAALIALLALLALGVVAVRVLSSRWSGGEGRDARPAGAPAPAPAPPPDVDRATDAWELPLPTGAEGWEEAAETVALDLRRVLLGRPSGGSYDDARAAAARRDLALYPPEPARLRRLLLAPSQGDRMLALAALAARGEATDDLVRIALRSARPEDEDVLRLLSAELVSALPAEQLARHEDDLLRAFEREPNPLVLAVALPALERLDAPRLRALLDAQLSVASPEMVPVLAALARDRLGPEGLRSIGISVFEGRGLEGAGGE
jgi:hypothetical protein